MTAALGLDYTYRYPFASDMEREGEACTLRLATFDGRDGQPQVPPFFFEGRLLAPQTMAEMMLALSNVVTSRFYQPQLALHIDPVVTGNEEILRLEGFSSCCGVYARVDFPADCFEGELRQRGTTNVDFNSTMRSALAQVRDRHEVRLAVGKAGVQLTGESGTVIEKKVSLPVRWIKGFAEVQAIQSTLRPRFEIPAVEARKFIKGLPRGTAPKLPSFVTPLGAGLRLSQRDTQGSVRLSGTDRLKLLEPLVNSARSLRVWADETSGASAWEVAFERGRFLIVLSAEIWRGFSGEGQLLQQLASKDWEAALPLVQANLRWQSRIDAQHLARQLSFLPDQIDGALAVLASRGLVGFDVVTGQYFHRELPFNMSQVEALQPRLKDARKLLEQQRVRIQARTAGAELTAEVFVQGTDVEHRVLLKPDADSCTCQWYSKHRLERGPCKHILAARLKIEDDS